MVLVLAAADPFLAWLDEFCLWTLLPDIMDNTLV